MKFPTALTLLICILSCKQVEQPSDRLNLNSKLSGHWVASAFDGELRETWTLGHQGWMEQEGFYIENGDTSYSAVTQIQQVGEEIILFSVIKDSNPKIFKAIESQENLYRFKNDDYKNPFEVQYEFISSNEYRRTITGYEGDSLVTYEFNFQKQ